MKMKTLALLGCIASFAAPIASQAAQNTPLKGHEYLKQAKIPLELARAEALKARPGRIVDQELEKEAGGSGLRYSFDIVTGGQKIEVGVDAVTGKVLENAAESAGREAQETKHEAK